MKRMRGRNTSARMRGFLVKLAFDRVSWPTVTDRSQASWIASHLWYAVQGKRRVGPP